MQNFCVTLFSQLAVPLKLTQLAREGCCRCYDWCWTALLDMTQIAHCESHIGKHSQSCSLRFLLRICGNSQCCRATSACQSLSAKTTALAQPNTDAEEFMLSYSIGQLSNRWKADMARRSSVHAGGTQCNGGCTRLLLTGIRCAERGALSFQAQAVQDCIGDLGNLVWVWQVIRSATSKCVQSNSQSIVWCAQDFVLQAIHSWTAGLAEHEHVMYRIVHRIGHKAMSLLMYAHAMQIGASQGPPHDCTYMMMLDAGCYS